VSPQSPRRRVPSALRASSYPPRWVELFRSIEFEKQKTMYPHSVAFWNSALPDAPKRFIKLLRRTTRPYFVNKCDILVNWKDQREFFGSSRENVVNRICSAVYYLNVFHVFQHRIRNREPATSIAPGPRPSPRGGLALSDTHRRFGLRLSAVGT
jgi:hypothetical protein